MVWCIVLYNPVDYYSWNPFSSSDSVWLVLWYPAALGRNPWRCKWSRQGESSVRVCLIRCYLANYPPYQWHSNQTHICVGIVASLLIWRRHCPCSKYFAAVTWPWHQAFLFLVVARKQTLQRKLSRWRWMRVCCFANRLVCCFAGANNLTIWTNRTVHPRGTDL